MVNDDKIAQYTKGLFTALRGLPTDEREDIVAEIKAHLEYRMAEGKLDAAIDGLGAPAVCGRAFRDELTLQTAFHDGGPRQTFGALMSLATRRVIAAVGLFIASLCLIISIGMALSAIGKIISPNTVGLWTHNNTQHVSFGAFSNAPNEAYTEHLGIWYFPLASLLAVGFYLFGHRIGQLFLSVMIGRKRPLAAPC